MIKELQELKDTTEGKGKYDRANAVFTIVAGAGGDDAGRFCAHAGRNVPTLHREKRLGGCWF